MSRFSLLSCQHRGADTILKESVFPGPGEMLAPLTVPLGSRSHWGDDSPTSVAGAALTLRTDFKKIR